MVQACSQEETSQFGPKPDPVRKPVSLYMSSEQSWTESQVCGGAWSLVYLFLRDMSDNGSLAIFINFGFGGSYEDVGLWVSKIIPTSNGLVFTMHV